MAYAAIYIFYIGIVILKIYKHFFHTKLTKKPKFKKHKIETVVSKIGVEIPANKYTAPNTAAATFKLTITVFKPTHFSGLERTSQNPPMANKATIKIVATIVDTSGRHYVRCHQKGRLARACQLIWLKSIPI